MLMCLLSLTIKPDCGEASTEIDLPEALRA